MSTLMYHAYLFEAKGIQRWILEGGRLRDIATASNLLATCFRSDNNDLLAPALAAAGPGDTFSRRAGGAFMLHYREDQQDRLDRFRALWRLIFMQTLPGLEFVESFGQGATPEAARAAAYDQTKQRRTAAGRENSLAGLPPYGHPLAAFAPRTGRPAVPSTGSERIDAVTRTKRLHAPKSDVIGQMFLAAAAASPPPLWPNQMDDDPDIAADDGRAVLFPFTGDDRWIAVVHADISALGRFYAALRDVAAEPDKAISMAREASGLIEAAVIAAAQRASAATLLPVALNDVMPARPILIGGDDMTIILRGDVALPFTQSFLVHLEQESATKLSDFADRHGITAPAARGPLTATAGVAFGKAKQPFFRLLELAEDLCGHAKTHAKQASAIRPPSAVSFLRITESALPAKADGMFDRLQTASGRLHAQPYRVGQVAARGFVDLEALDVLRQDLTRPGLRPGGLREVRSLLLQGLDDLAQESWQRWQQIAARRSRDGFDKLMQTLTPLLGGAPGSGPSLFAPPATQGGPADGGTPLFDALEWNAITGANEP
nr:hypothetical protein [uncultured Rhodopila sp.]